MESIPASHTDLMDRPLHAVLTTEMPDGRLQSTVVWFSRSDGSDNVLVNTMQEFQKARNMRLRPRATLLVAEPPDAARWIELRCDVELSLESAMEHLDELARMYTGVVPYFGGVVASELAAVEHPIVGRLHPLGVTTGPGQVGPAERFGGVAPDQRRSCSPDVALPADHLDLLGAPVLAVLSTRVGARAQTHPTWFEVDGNDVLVNTTLERRKGRNLLADRRATVLVVDPADAGRWIEIRGDVDIQTSGAIEQLDRLTRRYTSHDSFYGGVYPAERQAHETRVVARIHPRRVNVDAIH
jgi:PPOX class probable F420-dependent enzyme